jgi:hypothetical protein
MWSDAWVAVVPLSPPHPNANRVGKSRCSFRFIASPPLKRARRSSPVPVTDWIEVATAESADSIGRWRGRGCPTDTGRTTTLVRP